mmetsp:Transcript_62775/g.111943  ORF Transcript_62775/g.111943 Transcript_62775/m.111943 type:complete len:207 (+) Transcript_62775:3554-4174(+)
MPDSLPIELEGLRGDFVDSCSLGVITRPLAHVDTGERILSPSVSLSDLATLEVLEVHLLALLRESSTASSSDIASMVGTRRGPLPGSMLTETMALSSNGMLENRDSKIVPTSEVGSTESTPRLAFRLSNDPVSTGQNSEGAAALGPGRKLGSTGGSVGRAAGWSGCCACCPWNCSKLNSSPDAGCTIARAWRSRGRWTWTCGAPCW